MTKEKIHFSGIEKWTKKASRSSIGNKVVFLILFLMCLILVITGIWNILLWNKRISSWDRVPGIILSNRIEKKRSGKTIKKVSAVSYKYKYKNRSYTGDRILYDSSEFPPWVKKGSTRTILVDPENPAKSAVMFTYKGHWYLLRYVPTVLFSILAIFFLTLFLRSLPERSFILPEKLQEYIQQSSPGTLKLYPPISRCDFYMDFPPEEPDKDHWIIRSKKPAGLLLSTGIASFVLACTAIFLQANIVIFIHAFISIIMILRCMQYPMFLVFDLREKCYYRCRKFAPEKMLKVKRVSFADIKGLCLQALPDSRECLVCAVNRKNAKLNLFKIRSKDLPLYGDFLPVLAKNMGNIP
ncbi:MAG: DUF3592 domain-containing protein, partial [Lentisphaeria bacterium]|nr:DUF3592 domain-containing protein [Lentisphaeria bacterium]